MHAVQIESPYLDWRRHLDVPISAFDLGDDMRSRLTHVLKILGLTMGVFDFKLDRVGNPVWLEVNPQGQFLFMTKSYGERLGSCGTGQTKTQNK
jgi:D-alanine-D-alanine ligase-like ATP-grasp enzyme